MSARSTKGAVDRVREEAVRQLEAARTGGGFVEDRLGRWEVSPAARGWEYVERRRLRELVFGCVRLRLRYDHLVDRLARRGSKVDPRVRAVLQVALHEICELRSADFAVVDQAVEITRRLGRARASGFVNAVLRRVLREGPESFFCDAESDPIERAATWEAHPRWMVRRWADLLGPAETLALCEAGNRRPDLHLRCAPGRREEVREELGARGWESESLDFAPDGLVLRTRVPARVLLEEIDGGLVIQDAAAQAVAPLVAESQPERVLDLCAAPGGKTMHLAQLLPQVRVVAVDSSASRMERVGETARRLGLEERVQPLVADGTASGLEPGSFDAVLVDAPCTGTGVLARRHEARHLRRPEDLDRLPELQVRLLREALRLVRPGGVVVYATCSLESEENDAVVDRVLEADQSVEEIGVGPGVPERLQRGGRLQIWPQREGCDGAFAARLRRLEPGSGRESG